MSAKPLACTVRLGGIALVAGLAYWLLSSTWAGAPVCAQPLAATIPTPSAADYAELGQMRLPWASDGVDPRYLMDDWVDRWARTDPGARGLGWDFARSPSGVDIANTPLLAPSAGYVSSSSGWNGGYGNFVDVQPESGWGVRLAHLADKSAVRREFNGRWIPQGVPVGNLGNTGRSEGYHIHLELRWNDTAPPSASSDRDRGYQLRLPADSRPFGVPRDQLRNPAAPGVPVSGNQQVYQPVVEIVWPYGGTVIPWDSGQVPDQQARLRVTTQEWSSLHEYRWELRSTSGELLASHEWERAAEGPTFCSLYYSAHLPLEQLGRGKYLLRAQARFPDIREGQENSAGYTSTWAEAGLTVLDLGNLMDRLRWEFQRPFVRPAHAAEEPPGSTHISPPPPMSPSMEPDLEPSDVGPGQPAVGPTNEQAAMIAAVQAFVDAIDRQDVDAAIGTFRPQDQLVLRLLATVGKPLLQQSGVDIDFERLGYEVLGQGDGGTVVRVTGKAILRSTEDGSIVNEFDEYYADVPVVKFLGRWYVHVDLAEFLSAMREQ